LFLFIIYYYYYCVGVVHQASIRREVKQEEEEEEEGKLANKQCPLSPSIREALNPPYTTVQQPTKQ